MAIVGFASAMLVFGSDEFVVDQTWDVCSRLQRDTCEAWPQVAPSRCAEALRCVDHPLGAGCVGFQQPNFECAWVPDENLNNWTWTLMPESYRKEESCVRLRCPIDEYARGVALEFAVLLLTISYVSIFGLHDVKRLLDRPPPKQHGTLINVEATTAPLTAAQGSMAGSACAPAEPHSGVSETCERAPRGAHGLSTT